MHIRAILVDTVDSHADRFLPRSGNLFRLSAHAVVPTLLKDMSFWLGVDVQGVAWTTKECAGERQCVLKKNGGDGKPKIFGVSIESLIVTSVCTVVWDS